MVLESLINPFKAEKEPWEMLIIGFIYCTIAIFLSLWIFEDSASLVMVFLTVMACVPLMYSVIKLEEEKDLKIKEEKKLIKEHGRALLFFIFLFLGITLAVSLWYVVLPQQTVNNLFYIQTKTITTINSKATGNFLSGINIVSKIFLNNLRVMIFCLLFAFIYGVGAIFILTWNASVIGVAIGSFIRNNIFHYNNLLHLTSKALLRYLPHGTLEILAYFIAGLAGGIISIAVIRHDFRTKKFEHIVTDSVDLILLAFLILFIAALIEVYVTPLIFTSL